MILVPGVLPSYISCRMRSYLLKNCQRRCMDVQHVTVYVLLPVLSNAVELWLCLCNIGYCSKSTLPSYNNSHTQTCLTIARYHIKVYLIATRTSNSDAFLGGVVLWSHSFTPEASHIASTAASPVNSLIREALIEGRTAEQKYEKDGYAVKWTFVNDLELIFVVQSSC